MGRPMPVACSDVVAQPRRRASASAWRISPLQSPRPRASGSVPTLKTAQSPSASSARHAGRGPTAGPGDVDVTPLRQAGEDRRRGARIPAERRSQDGAHLLGLVGALPLDPARAVGEVDLVQRGGHGLWAGVQPVPAPPQGVAGPGVMLGRPHRPGRHAGLRVGPGELVQRRLQPRRRAVDHAVEHGAVRHLRTNRGQDPGAADRETARAGVAGQPEERLHAAQHAGVEDRVVGHAACQCSGSPGMRPARPVRSRCSR